MKKFIPLEDDWSLLDTMGDQALVPYQVGMPCGERRAGTIPADDEKSFAPPSQPWQAAL